MKEMQTKDAVRRQMRARRKALTPEERERAAKAICAKLRSDDAIHFDVVRFVRKVIADLEFMGDADLVRPL